MKTLCNYHVLGAIALLLGTALGGCGADDGEALPGTLSLTIYGEEFLEDKIPAEEFNDGWEVTFSRFLVSVVNTTAFNADDTSVRLLDEQYRVFDLAQPSGGAGYAVTSNLEAPGGLYDRFSYDIAPPGDPAITSSGNGSADSVGFMINNGYAVFVEGLASKDAEQVTFAWGFTAGTRYNGCEAVADIDGDEATVELTIHGDHLFYDDLVSEEPNVSFQLIADSDGDGDGVITMEELAALDITGEQRYQSGSLDIDNLYDFIDQQVSTLGHIAGEGHCATISRL
ncbi:MAG: hypothetical protein AAGC55_23435 [Myxococcota bacterium]